MSEKTPEDWTKEEAELADWVNELAGDYVESWVGRQVASGWIEDRKRIALLEKSAERRWMPIIGYPLAIRWDLLDENQAMKNHSQTLQRLSERGGLGLDEALAIVESRQWRKVPLGDALKALRAAGYEV